MKKSYLFFIVVGVLSTIILSVISFICFQHLISTLSKAYTLRVQKFDFLSLLSDLKDAETGQRGFVITGDESYLEPYYAALKKIENDISHLNKEVLPLSKKQVSLFQDLFHLIQIKLAELSDSIHTRRTEGFAAAQKKVNNHEGKHMMDQIRGVIDQFVLYQNQEENRMDQLIQALIDRSLWLNLLGLAVSSAMISLFSFLFYRDSVKLGMMKRQFKETYDLYKVILDNAKQMIIATDTKGMVTSFNKGAEKILGYKTNEVTHQASILNFYHREALQKKVEEMEQKKHLKYDEFEALVAPSRFLIWVDSEWIMKKKNGNLFKSSQSITALRDESNAITGYLFIGSDLTDDKKWEQELQEAQEAISMAQLSKNQFLTSLNHELRAPLNSIINFSTLLTNNVGGNLTDLEISYAKRIKDHCQAMISAINEILAISKQEENVLQLSVTPLQTPNLVEGNQVNPSLANHLESHDHLSEMNAHLTILVIDDDLDFRSILTTYLEDLGCRVIPAATGAEVIQLAKTHPVDLIIMDMLMSPMNGYDIVQQLQSDPHLKEIPYAFISIIAKEIKNKIPGALAFIDKPITREDLIHLLQIYQAQHRN